MFRAIALTIVAALFFYLTHQVLQGAEFSGVGVAAVVGFIGVLFGLVLALPLYFWMASRRDHKPWYDRFYFVTYLALAYINFLIFFVVLRDLIAAAGWAFDRNFVGSSLYNSSASLWLLGLPFIAIALGTLVVRAGVKHKKVVLDFPELPAKLDGFRILHISDLHIGDSLPRNFVESLIKKANKLSIDIVVFTGDILDGAIQRHHAEVHLLKSLRHRYGVFYVPGNHEYYWQAEHSVDAFRKLGFEVLINESRVLKLGDAILQISGVPDPEARNFGFETPDFEKLKSALLPEAFHVLLSHQPRLADQAAPYGYDLQLSGHTHGGQFFPWNFLVGLIQKYAKGLYHIGDLQLYVNQGAGYWGPSVRLGTYCELAEIVLTRSVKG
jgi:hypothetical protein